MAMQFSRFLLTGMLGAGLMLAACDNAEDRNEVPATIGGANGDDLPVLESVMPTAPDMMTEENGAGQESGGDIDSEAADAPAQTGVPGVSASGSMAADSPAGEMVTEDELPHSDVPAPSRDVFVNAECEFESWVGQDVDEEAVKQTGRNYRILKPGSVMTMDHRPDRINVEHDDNNIVTRVWCG
ncbi:MAG: I78 family peptidase inhibitor [Micavibrio sp.]